MDLQGRSLLNETDLSAAEFRYLIDLAGQLRRDKRLGQRGRRLAGRNIALIFEKIGAHAGEVLPQKSTDFYPKLLSGLTIYALE